MRFGGVSGKSQVLLLVVFISRYLDMFQTFISYYNTAMKILFIGLTALTVFLIFIIYKSTYNSKQDDFHAWILLIGAAALAYFVNNECSFNFMEIMWTFSIYLEAVAMLPQFSMIIRAGKMEMFMYHYLFAYGCYRAYYIFNWVYRYSYEGFYDKVSFGSGCLQTVFYCYFLYSTRFLKMQARAQFLEQNERNEEDIDKLAVSIDGLGDESVSGSTVDTELSVNDGRDDGLTPTVTLTSPVPGHQAQADTSPNTEHTDNGVEN